MIRNIRVKFDDSTIIDGFIVPTLEDEFIYFQRNIYDSLFKLYKKTGTYLEYSDDGTDGLFVVACHFPTVVDYEIYDEVDSND